jgi:hypothetical protein
MVSPRRKTQITRIRIIGRDDRGSLRRESGADAFAQSGDQTLCQFLPQHQLMSEGVIVGTRDLAAQVGEQSFEQVAKKGGFLIGEIYLHFSIVALVFGRT